MKQQMVFQYKKENPELEKRKQESYQILNKFPDKVPVICEKDPKSKITSIVKTRYLIPKNYTISQFSYIIRKKVVLKNEESFYLLANGMNTISGKDTMFEIYERYKDEDGFLYISYTSEVIWGNFYYK
jgi:GABA(A) receptor-associated protein